MILSISWKNIWRNKFRSIIIMLAITFGIWTGLFLFAFMVGMGKQRLNSAIKTEVSHIQIHQPNYLLTDSIELYIENSSEIVTDINSNPKVKGASSRLLFKETIGTTARNNAGFNVIGVNPEQEKKVTDIHENIIKGSYFEGKKRNPIVIGEELAEKLDIKERSRIQISFYNTNGVSLPVTFKVEGIYETNNAQYDQMHVFVKKEDLASILGISNNAAHEIAVLLHDGDNLDAVDEELEKAMPDLEVETWEEGFLVLRYMNDMMDMYMYIFIGIILLALLFGIINTMLMSVMERKKELGMLKAVGMNNRRLFVMILIETVLLSFTGAALGIGLGFTTIGILGNTGIDLSMWGEGIEQLGYAPVVYPALDLKYYVIISILVLITAFIASIFPSVKIIRIKAVNALRTDN